MVLDVTNGYVGLGAAAPKAKLQINSVSASTAATYPGDILLDDGGTNGPSAIGGLEFLSSAGANSGYGFKFYTNNSSDYLGLATRYNNTAWTERMAIKSQTGNMGIGTITPDARLKVAGSRSNTISTSTSIAAIGGDDVNIRFGVLYGTPNWGSWIQSIADSGSAQQLSLNPSGGNVGIGTTAPGYALDVNGDVRATSYLYASDRNLKTNIQTINSPLAKIVQLRGVTFNWKSNNKPSVGLIAQEVQQVFPELVTADNSGMLSVQYGNLVAPLVEAVKEQQEEIQSLNQRLEVLEAKVKK